MVLLSTLLQPLCDKPEHAVFRHSGECRNPIKVKRSKSFWTPAPVPDSDPGFAGVTIGHEITFFS
jgi:hypothetical protein